ncbi:MAG: hypothetical protein M3472_01565, partial [Chloroflexota bacterium]|nr:hypothetical protein [Chloroflexota bacterium]
STSAATLNGLITEQLGRFPEVDDRIELDDHHLTVRSVGGNRANEVLIERVGTVPPPAADESVGAGLGTGVNPTEDP